jgi:hypothetical protein
MSQCVENVCNKRKLHEEIEFKTSQPFPLHLRSSQCQFYSIKNFFKSFKTACPFGDVFSWPVIVLPG